MIVNQWPEILDEDVTAVLDQLKYGELSSAGKIKIIEDLENKFASMTNSKYALALSSGTMSLYSALFAMGIESGDEVVVPVYTYHAVAAPLIAMNVTPVFADIDDTYGHISAETIEKCITKKTKAIILVHSYGYPVDMDPINKLADQYKLDVIEDCSHAHGAKYKGRSVGGLGDIGFFSLQASKLVPAGEGGILVTNNQEYYEKALLLGHHFDRTSLEIEDSYYKEFTRTGLGLKLRINPLGAALANSQFNRLENNIERKTNVYSYISEKILDLEHIDSLTPKEYMTKPTFYSYRLKFKNSIDNNIIQKFMKSINEVNSNISFSGGRPLNEETLFKKQNYDFGFIKKYGIEKNKGNSFDGFKQYQKSIFRVPLYYKSQEELDFMIKNLRTIYFNFFDY